MAEDKLCVLKRQYREAEEKFLEIVSNDDLSDEEFLSARGEWNAAKRQYAADVDALLNSVERFLTEKSRWRNRRTGTVIVVEAIENDEVLYDCCNETVRRLKEDFLVYFEPA